MAMHFLTTNILFDYNFYCCINIYCYTGAPLMKFLKLPLPPLLVKLMDPWLYVSQIYIYIYLLVVKNTYSINIVNFFKIRIPQKIVINM